MQPSISASAFTTALSLAANGVSIVTTNGEHGKAGLTVSSMCSVCAEPALVLACVNASNEFCAKAEANKLFAINILGLDQQAVSNVFAGFGNSEEDRFNTGNWSELKTGSPILTNAMVSLDCELVSHTTHGTHTIYIGRVVDLQSQDKPALVYTARSYAKTEALS